MGFTTIFIIGIRKFEIVAKTLLYLNLSYSSCAEIFKKKIELQMGR